MGTCGTEERKSVPFLYFIDGLINTTEEFQKKSYNYSISKKVIDKKGVLGLEFLKDKIKNIDKKLNVSEGGKEFNILLKEKMKLENELIDLQENEEENTVDESVPLESNFDLLKEDVEDVETMKTDNKTFIQKTTENIKGVDYKGIAKTSKTKGKEWKEKSGEGWEKSKPYRDEVKRKMFGFDTGRAEKQIHEYIHGNKFLDVYRKMVIKKKRYEEENNILQEEYDSLENDLEKSMSKGDTNKSDNIREKMKNKKHGMRKNNKFIQSVINKVENISVSPKPFFFRKRDVIRRFLFISKGIPVGYQLITFIFIQFFFIFLFRSGVLSDLIFGLGMYVFITYLTSFFFNKKITKQMYEDREYDLLEPYVNLFKIFDTMVEFVPFKPNYKESVKEIANHEGKSVPDLSVDIPIMNTTEEPLDESKNEISKNNPLNDKWEELLQYLIPKSQHDKIVLPKYQNQNETEIHIFDIPILPFQKIKDNIQLIESFTKKQVYQPLKDYKGTGTVGIELINKQPPKVFDYDYVKIDPLDPLYEENVVVGLDAKGKVYWNFKKVPHGIFSGTTGSGKTVALMNVVEQFNDRGHNLYFVDFKKEEFAFFRKKGYEVATEREDAVNLIERIESEVDYRQKQRENSSREEFTHTFLIIDEFADITGTKDRLMERSMEKLKRIGSQGRTVNVHIIIATQRPSAESLGSTDFRNNLGFRLVGKLKDGSSSGVALDNDFAFTRLPDNDYGGMFIIKSSQNSPDDSVVRTPFVDKFDFIEYVETNWKENPFKDYILGDDRSVGSVDKSVSNKKNTNPLDSRWKDFVSNEFSKYSSKYKTPTVIQNDGTEIHVMKIDGITASDYEKKRDNIKATIKKSVYKIHSDYNSEEGATGIELTTGQLPSLIAFDEIPYNDDEPYVYIGKDVKGWVKWDIDDQPNALIVGISKSGKSVLTNNIINQIQRKGEDFMMIFADLKGGLELTMYEDKLYTVVDNVDDFSDLTDLMKKEMDRRMEIWKTMKAKNYKGYKKKVLKNGEKPLPRIVFIVDEFARATTNPDDDIKNNTIKNIDLLLSQCRAVGIHLILITQKPSIKSLGSGEAKNNLQLKLSSRLDASGSKMIYEDTRAFTDIPPQNYAGLFIGLGLESESVIRTPFLDDDEFEEMVEAEWKENIYKDYVLGEATFLNLTENIPKGRDEFKKIASSRKQRQIPSDDSVLGKEYDIKGEKSFLQPKDNKVNMKGGKIRVENGEEVTEERNVTKKNKSPFDTVSESNRESGNKYKNLSSKRGIPPIKNLGNINSKGKLK
ncbi:FtsK/SpoIIIE domain-containing protein [Virgibacillus sp. DJP39]|uniref:FtsK/SpoIIIE domain-containing protein n=1 Tax=Virgibacillus sp. DJP39 TaxID=3409790 RepID=UPI003BB66489